MTIFSSAYIDIDDIPNFNYIGGLHMQGLNKEIAERYNLDIKSVSPYKDLFVLVTPYGKKFLRKVIGTQEKLYFIHEAKEHLYKNGFTNIDRDICTLDGKPFIILEEGAYIITEAVEGRECNFDLREDTIKASQLLAQMHKASRGYVPSMEARAQDDLGKLPVYFLKRLEEIKKLKKLARKGKSKFDYLFLENVDYYVKLAEKTLEQLGNSKYNQLIERTRQEGLFCHHDYTHHNIICSENKAGIINFSFCCFELKVYDLANLLRRKMRKCNWNTEEARVIIQKYDQIEHIDEDELEVMKLILQFPQKFWRVVNKYYNSRRSWSEKSFILKLEEVTKELEPHKNFMNKYDEITLN